MAFLQVSLEILLVLVLPAALSTHPGTRYLGEYLCSAYISVIIILHYSVDSLYIFEFGCNLVFSNDPEGLTDEDTNCG